jgi:hypothetical protein
MMFSLHMKTKINPLVTREQPTFTRTHTYTAVEERSNIAINFKKRKAGRRAEGTVDFRI